MGLRLAHPPRMAINPHLPDLIDAGSPVGTENKAEKL
jgi:hypothetical protein